MALEHSPARKQRSRPRFARIPEALTYAGISKSRFYEWARERPELVRKNGRASLVDFEVFDEILNALPTADLKATAARSNDPA
jgi:hypothetical protein